MDGHLPFLFEIPSNCFPTLLRSWLKTLSPSDIVCSLMMTMKACFLDRRPPVFCLLQCIGSGGLVQAGRGRGAGQPAVPST